ncbi:MAG: thioredoxin family protein [Anaerolineae bacterium]|nr:thioredoxin family protein [Anaerolineae bacterium]
MTTLALGANAVPFELTGTDNKHYSLGQYSDKEAVAVIFTCNHCPYAQAWEDRIVQIQKDYAGKGVQVVAINANDAEKHPSDSPEKMKERAQAKGFNFPYLYDETQEVARAYGAERTPEVFVFDKAGNMRYHGAIDDNADEPDAVQNHYLRDALDAVLSGTNPAVTDTAPKGCTIKWRE